MRVRVVTERCAAPSRRLHRGEASVDERESLLVKIARDGHVGVGEACPFPGLSPDDLDIVEASVPRELAPLREVGDLDEVLGALPPGLPALAFAVETALVDLRRLERGLRWADVWGPSHAVETTGLTTLGEALSEGPRLVERGARTLKLKVAAADAGATPDVLRALRERIGGAIGLRLDLNGGLDDDGAHRFLEAVAPFGVELVEEPSSTPESLGPSCVPWALDESLLRPEVQEAWATLGASVIVLKPTLLGGARACLRLAEAARNAGMGVIVTHAFEGEVAQRACAALAAAIPGVLPSGVRPSRGFSMHPEDL